MIANDFSSIVVDTRWDGDHGIGRFAREIIRRLPHAVRLRTPLGPLHPLDCLYTGLYAGREGHCLFTPGFNPPLFCRQPVVFTLHDLIPIECPEETTWTKRLYFEAVVRRAARRAFRVVTVSEYSRQKIVDWCGMPPERVVVAYNGVSAAFCPDGPRRQPGYEYLLYVGNQKPHKNLNRLFAAFASMVQDTGLRLVMTGAPSDSTRADLQRWGLGSRVDFCGALSEEELAACYRGANSVVLPSCYEGFGLPIVEAMACGTPVVCARAAAMPEIAGDAAWFVDPLDARNIAAGIERVLSDRGLRAGLRERGLARARRFDWNATAATIGNVLLAAVESAVTNDCRAPRN